MSSTGGELEFIPAASPPHRRSEIPPPLAWLDRARLLQPGPNKFGGQSPDAASAVQSGITPANAMPKWVLPALSQT